MEGHVRASFKAFSFTISVVPASNVTTNILAIHNNNTIIFYSSLYDQIRHHTRIRKRWGILSNLVRRQNRVHGKRLEKLGLELVADDDNGVLYQGGEGLGG